MWKEARVPGENPRRHGKNMQTPHTQWPQTVYCPLVDIRTKRHWTKLTLFKELLYVNPDSFGDIRNTLMQQFLTCEVWSPRNQLEKEYRVPFRKQASCTHAATPPCPGQPGGPTSPSHCRPGGWAVCHSRRVLPTRVSPSWGAGKWSWYHPMPPKHRGLFWILYFNLLCVWLSLSTLSLKAWAGVEETIVRLSLLNRRGRWKMYTFFLVGKTKWY